jgi:hypothetical protein
MVETLPVLQMRKKEIDYTSSHIYPTCTTNEKKEIDYASSHIYPTCTTNEKKEMDYTSYHIDPKRKHSIFLSSSFVVQVGSIWQEA